jgi:hypothetical protein
MRSISHTTHSQLRQLADAIENLAYDIRDKLPIDNRDGDGPFSYPVGYPIRLVILNLVREATHVAGWIDAAYWPTSWMRRDEALLEPKVWLQAITAKSATMIQGMLRDAPNHQAFPSAYLDSMEEALRLLRRLLKRYTPTGVRSTGDDEDDDNAFFGLEHREVVRIESADGKTREYRTDEAGVFRSKAIGLRYPGCSFRSVLYLMPDGTLIESATHHRSNGSVYEEEYKELVPVKAAYWFFNRDFFNEDRGPRADEPPIPPHILPMIQALEERDPRDFEDTEKLLDEISRANRPSPGLSTMIDAEQPKLREAEKRSRILTTLIQHPDWSHRKIARAVRCSATYVGKVIREGERKATQRRSSIHQGYRRKDGSLEAIAE